VVLGNLYDEFNSNHSRTVFMPYPYILESRERKEPVPLKNDNRQKVVDFWGTVFAEEGVQPIKSREFAAMVNKCLSFLRRNYANTHRLVYRPHPQETDRDWRLLDLEQFELETDRQIAELYMYDNREIIEAMFSVHSTSSRSAVNFGINSYVFCETFGFDELTNQHNRRHLGRQPDGFYIKDLANSPTEYQEPQRLEYVRKVLQQAVTSIFE
jgi:hypothetical protein